MDNEKLAKELLGYTYIDIQEAPGLYKLLGVDTKEFIQLYSQEEYIKALYSLLDNSAAKILIHFLMNPLNRLKELS